MQGNWVAECTLCEWASRFVEQDDALRTATLHAMREHTEQQASLASGKWITHVQQRATDAIGSQPPVPPEVLPPASELKVVSTLDEARALAAPAPEGA